VGTTSYGNRALIAMTNHEGTKTRGQDEKSPTARFVFFVIPSCLCDFVVVFGLD
jgi:hypothetical protein